MKTKNLYLLTAAWGLSQLLPLDAQAQVNLITNGSFDMNQSVPPTRYGNIANPYNSGGELAGWSSYNSATPDYFSTNATVASSNPATTDAVRGIFTPRTGPGAVGLFYSTDTRTNPHVELITQQISSLAQNSAYYYEFYAQRANYSGSMARLEFRAHPSTQPLTNWSSDFAIPTNHSAAPGGSSGLLAFFSWTRVAGVFNTAGATYDKITIGINGAGSFPLNGSQTGKGPAPYYYIDDVVLYKVPAAGPGPNCIPANSSFTLGVGEHIPGSTYVWTTDPATTTHTTTGPRFIAPAPASPLAYILTVTLPNGQTSVSRTGVISTCPPCPVMTNVDQVTTVCGTKYCDYTFTNIGLSLPPGWSYRIYNNAPLSDPPVPGSLIGNGAWLPISSYPSTVLTLPNPTEWVHFEFKGPDASCANFFREVGLMQPGQARMQQAQPTAFPNPVSDFLTVAEGNTSAELTNLQGKVVLTQSKGTKMDVRSLPNGLYLLRTRQNGKTTTTQIEVKH